MKYSLGLMSALICLTSSAWSQTPEQVVESFYPQHLINSAQDSEPGEPFDKNSCFAVYDSQTIVAAYSNDTLGAVLLLKGDSQHGYQANEFTETQFSGTDCSLELADLAGNGTKQVIVSFPAASGNTMDWVFNVEGSKLTNVGPTASIRGGKAATVLLDATVMDLYHDGGQEIVSGYEYPPSVDGSLPATTGTIYQFKDGKLQASLSGSIFETSLLQASPEINTFYFLRPKSPPGPYVLRVVNGDRYSGKRIVNGFIRLNGKLVTAVTPSMNVVTVNVDLVDNNELQISAGLPEGGQLLVSIETAPLVPPVTLK